MKKSIVRVLALVLMLTLVITSSAAALKLQKNDKSDNVRRLQQALMQLGYYSGTVDGSFGSGTKAAVTAFQQANSLTVTVSPVPRRLLCWKSRRALTLTAIRRPPLRPRRGCLRAITANCSTRPAARACGCFSRR